jgi:hypothetical protein
MRTRVCDAAQQQVETVVSVSDHFIFIVLLPLIVTTKAFGHLIMQCSGTDAHRD